MNLYELTKTYGSGKGEGMMWKAVEIISEAVDKSMPEPARNNLMRKIYGEMSGGHYNETFADEDISKMYYIDKSGNKHAAPYWPTNAVHEIYETVKGQIQPYNCWDFAVTLNMIASDTWPLLEKWFPDMTTEERNAKTTELAVNWLRDVDNPFGDSKVWCYFNSK